MSQDRNGLLAPLQVPDYRKLWIARTVSVVGDKVNQIAMAMLVYDRTDSMLQMGIMLGVTTLPAVLFSVFAGVFVDRWDRRMTMIIADVLRALLVLLVPWLAGISIFAAYGVAFAVATVSLFFEPARMAMVPDIIDEETLMAANSLDSASEAASELLGLAFGGAIVALLGYQTAFVIDSATYVVSALVIMLVAHRPPRIVRDAAAAFPNVRREFSEGVIYIWRQPVLRDLISIYAVAAVALAASITLAHLLALFTYGAGSVGLALLDSAITVGILAGSVLVGRSGPGRPGIKFLAGLTVFGASFAVISLIPSLTPALALLLLGGAANMWFQVPMATMLQSFTEPALRGRVFAARTAVVRTSTIFGLVGAGAAAERFGVMPMVAVVGIAVVIVAGFGWTRVHLRTA